LRGGGSWYKAKGMEKFRGLLLATAVSCMAGAALGQVDPELRELLQAGLSQSVQGASPVAAYGYYYLNEPNFFHTNVTLRLALAPVYLDSEVGFVGLLGPHTDLGIGLAGGGFADNYYEFEGGKYLPQQSLTGDSEETSISVYHLFDPGRLIPLFGLLRVKEHYSLYQPLDELAPGFVLPHDHASFDWRAGLRLGGREPLLTPALAMELSAWYEGQYRTDSGPYGFDGDRMLQPNSELFWMRALLIYTLPDTQQSFDVNFTAGTSGHADRFSAYRLGGSLPLASEFPLAIPGYFYQELSARNFISFNAQYTFPLDPKKTWSLIPMGAAAVVDYLPGTGQPGAFNSGAGLAVDYHSRSGKWQIMASYGYGFEAIRDSGRGAQAVGILFEVDLHARRPGEPTRLDQAIGFFPSHF
jgi:hypothetical protein